VTSLADDTDEERMNKFHSRIPLKALRLRVLHYDNDMVMSLKDIFSLLRSRASQHSATLYPEFPGL
jgi:hypothetical protein